MNYWIAGISIGTAVYLVVAGILIHQGLTEREENGPSSCSWMEIIFISGLWPLIFLGYYVIQAWYRIQNLYQYWKHRKFRYKL